MIVLAQQGGDGQTYIARTGHGHLVPLGGDCLGGGFGIVHIQIGNVKVQSLCQSLQLLNGGLEGHVFQLADHRAIDAGELRQIDLGQPLFLALCLYGFGQKTEGELFHREVSFLK